MKENLLDISSKIDEASLALYHDFAEVTGDVPWLVVGASARDLILHFEHGLPIVRATRDIDLGVQLRTWGEYKSLRQSLLNSGKFTLSNSEHRLYHKTRLPLDMVPFGSIASRGEILKWPHPASSEMNVIGYEDALRSANWVRLSSNPALDIRVATSIGIVILKTLSWADDPPIRAKDAQDLAYVILSYLDLGNWDRLQSSDADLTEREDFTTLLAGAQMLGRDIANTASPRTVASVLEVLRKEELAGPQSRLAAAMAMTLTYKNYNPLTLIVGLRRGIEGK